MAQKIKRQTSFFFQNIKLIHSLILFFPTQLNKKTGRIFFFFFSNNIPFIPSRSLIFNFELSFASSLEEPKFGFI